MDKKTEAQRVRERLDKRGALLAAIEKRRQEAEDKRINNKAHFVARELGEENEGNDESLCFRFDFERTGLSIVASRHMIGRNTAMDRTRINMNGSPVFVQDDTRIESYVPGDWEELLDRFYTEAEATHEERAAHRAQVESRRQAEEERKERAKWGL